MLAAEDAPYALLTYGNIEACSSQILRSLIDAGQIINVHADRHPDQPAQPAYMHGGITEEIQLVTKGSSAIDYVLTNHAGNQLIDTVTLRWDLAEGYDHVPNDVCVQAQLSPTFANTPVPVKPINTAALVDLTPQQQAHL